MSADLTDAELATAAKNYRVGMLDDGEGYNPYKAEIDRRSTAAEAARPRSRGERRDDLVREILRLDSVLARESGTHDAARVAQLRAEVAVIEADIQAEFAAEWTLEVTRARRTDWNARARAGKFSNPRKMRAAEQAQGWTMRALRDAIKMHGL